LFLYFKITLGSFKEYHQVFCRMSVTQLGIFLMTDTWVRFVGKHPQQR
jgi:hypothetical protein